MAPPPGLRALLVLALLALTACGTGETEIPEGAVRLVENQPTSWDGLRLVASDIWDDSATLVVSDGDGAAESAGLVIGGSATVAGRTFELIVVHEDAGDAAPGGSRSHVWVLPVE